MYVKICDLIGRTFLLCDVYESCKPRIEPVVFCYHLISRSIVVLSAVGSYRKSWAQQQFEIRHISINVSRSKIGIVMENTIRDVTLEPFMIPACVWRTRASIPRYVVVRFVSTSYRISSSPNSFCGFLTKNRFPVLYSLASSMSDITSSAWLPREM